MAERAIVKRGVTAGLIGGAALALWFLTIDALNGELLATPGLVAGALIGQHEGPTSFALIAAYTVVHFLMFAAVGIFCAWLLEKLNVTAHFLLGIVLGFLLFDLVFYSGVAITGIDVVRELGWPQVLVGNLIAGLCVFGYMHLSEPVPSASWRELLQSHRTLRESFASGLIAAGAVAVWFLVVDLVQGQLLFTPAALGSALLQGARGVGEVDVSAATVIGYTMVHLAGFMAAGFVAAPLVTRAEKYPPILLGLVLLFVTLEVFFFGLIAIVALWLLDAISWVEILVGNLIAAFAMGAYFWRKHPALRAAFSEPLEDEEYGYRIPEPRGLRA